MARVYRTRMVGYAPDARGPFKPPEVVYLVDDKPAPDQTAPLWRRVLWWVLIGLLVRWWLSVP